MAEDETVRIWPAAATGTEHWKVEERTFQIPTKDGALHLITDVTVPTLTIVRPARTKWRHFLI